MDNICFVIQPINADKFTKRFNDIYKPAIEAASLVPYRVDLDDSVKIPIEEIENKIENSIICFADISMDNPNVWYELGYAFALEKDVVMVCDESRSAFPFDIRHKNIIAYKTESASDFELLKNKITDKIKAYLSTQKATKKILDNPIKETEGLQSYELALLAFIIGEQMTDDVSISVYEICNRMKRAGYNNIAVSIGLRQLKRKKFIFTRMDSDYSGNEFPVCSLTPEGLNFVLKNIELFDLKEPQKIENLDCLNTDDLPF